MRLDSLQHILYKVGMPALLGIVVLSGVLAVSFSRQQAYAVSAVTINGATTHQTIDGFGAAEAFGKAQDVQNLSSSVQKQMLDLLYSTSTGAGLTILRILLPSSSSDTIEPNSPGSPNATPTYRALGSSEGQVWFAQQAKSYGVTQLYGDAWSAPGYMKTNGSESNGGAVCGTPGATCSSGDWRQAYANYLVQYARDYANAGVPLTEIGAFNEPNFTASYSSMSMTPAQTADMVRFLKPTLTTAGLNTRVVCCDPTGWPSAQTYTNAITSNASINSTVDFFSTHGYSGAPNSLLNGTGSKHVWETEWGIFDADNNNWDDGGQSDGFNWAQRIHTGMTAANLSAFLFWQGAEVNVGTNAYLVNYNGSSVIASGRLWAFANYSRFIRPGAVRIGASSGDGNLQVSAYKNTNGTVSIVVLNTASSAVTASYALQNLGVANSTTVTSYLTNNSNHMAQQASTSVSSASFSATIPARSLVTYVLNGTSVVTPTPTATSGTMPTPTPTATNGMVCSVQYVVTNQWAGGFGTSVTITNTGSATLNGWTLTWTFANGQTITDLWDGSSTQTGGKVSVTNLSYNGTLAPGSTTSFGFNGAWNGSNTNPTSFMLNGVPCTTV